MNAPQPTPDADATIARAVAGSHAPADDVMAVAAVPAVSTSAEPEMADAARPTGITPSDTGRPDRSAVLSRPTSRHVFTGAPVGVDSDLAGVWYLLPLLLRLSAPDQPEGPVPTWTELSAFGHRVLRRRLRARRLASDPLWSILEALAERDHDRTARTTRATARWWPEALDFLARHGVGPAELIIPGRICLTRTHVDVVLGLDQIDLRVRRAGLDRDPGWVPSLGRIIGFHFL